MNFEVAICLERKNELTEFLVDILTPYIYEGLTCIYKEAVRISVKIGDTSAVLAAFQKFLQQIPQWNQSRIVEETNRIKQLSNSAEYFDNLVKSVIRANIILLTNSGNVSNIIAQTFYNNFDTATLIHRCYTECGKDAHNYPHLYYHETDSPMEYKRNQVLIEQKIREGIVRAVRKVLPINLILQEYLANSHSVLHNPYPQPYIPPTYAQQQQPPQPMAMAPKVASRPLTPVAPALDPHLEREVLDMIHSASAQSQQERVQEIMKIGELIESSANRSVRSASVPQSNLREKTPEPVAPHLVDDFDDGVINISAMGGGSPPSRKHKHGFRMHNDDVSERVDPKKIKVIEEYAVKNGPMRKRS